MNIAIAGTGYVGLANAILLAQHHHVTAVDLVQDKVDAINARKSPLVDAEIEDYLKNKDLDLTATTDGAAAYAGADYVIVSTPTNYDPVKNYFDTSSVESVVRLVMQVNPNAIIVVKSTVPVGFTLGLRKKLGCEQLIFSPKDRERVGEQVVAAANEKLSQDGAAEARVGQLALSEEARPMRGGFILSDGEVEVNCAFETLVRLQREKLERRAAEILFED